MYILLVKISSNDLEISSNDLKISSKDPQMITK